MTDPSDSNGLAALRVLVPCMPAGVGQVQAAAAMEEAWWNRCHPARISAARQRGLDLLPPKGWR